MPDGCQVANFCHGICIKANTACRAKNLLLSSTGSYVYIIGSYGLGRKPISPLCTRPFRQVTTACTCPACPLHPLPMQLQAIHYSSLVISCLSLHPQQQIFPRTSSYQLLKPTALSGCTSIQAGEYFVYKSVLQVTSSNLRIQHTYLLLQVISLIRPQYAPLHFTSFSLAGSVIRGHLLRRRPLIPMPKAKPRSSAQLLLCAVDRNRAK